MDTTIQSALCITFHLKSIKNGQEKSDNENVNGTPSTVNQIIKTQYCLVTDTRMISHFTSIYNFIVTIEKHRIKRKRKSTPSYIFHLKN